MVSPPCRTFATVPKKEMRAVVQEVPNNKEWALKKAFTTDKGPGMVLHRERPVVLQEMNNTHRCNDMGEGVSGHICACML